MTKSERRPHLTLNAVFDRLEKQYLFKAAPEIRSAKFREFRRCFANGNYDFSLLDSAVDVWIRDNYAFPTNRELDGIYIQLKSKDPKRSKPCFCRNRSHGKNTWYYATTDKDEYDRDQDFERQELQQFCDENGLPYSCKTPEDVQTHINFCKGFRLKRMSKDEKRLPGDDLLNQLPF